MDRALVCGISDDSSILSEGTITFLWIGGMAERPKAAVSKTVET